MSETLLGLVRDVFFFVGKRSRGDSNVHTKEQGLCLVIANMR